jgi:hypothetical protein
MTTKDWTDLEGEDVIDSRDLIEAAQALRDELEEEEREPTEDEARFLAEFDATESAGIRDFPVRGRRSSRSSTSRSTRASSPRPSAPSTARPIGRWRTSIGKQRPTRSSRTTPTWSCSRPTYYARA